MPILFSKHLLILKKVFDMSKIYLKPFLQSNNFAEEMYASSEEGLIVFCAVVAVMIPGPGIPG